jgi:flagellum-specific ATP synthase
MNWEIEKDFYKKNLKKCLPYQEYGKLTQSIGLLFEARLTDVAVGSLCEIQIFNHEGKKQAVDAEVVGFKDKKIILMPFDDITGVGTASLVSVKKEAAAIRVSQGLLGRVIDAKENPLDDLGSIHSQFSTQERALYQKPIDPLKRTLIEEPLDVGIKSINGLLTIGKGQRVGIMAGSGVGKSVLLGMMAKYTVADVNVIGLVGERGREVREFIERDLGSEGLKKSVVIVGTSDQSPLLRMRTAFLATTIAEYFRDQGNNVLLMMDSVTRFCMAQREIGLSMGEPPASKGYTPSVFSMLPKLLERSGTDANGKSITGVYTVLVEGDDMDDPIADSVRSILDGHIVLSRKIAHKNVYPAIDVLKSASRVMRAIINENHLLWSNQIKDWIASYEQVEDLIRIGAYVKGNDLKVDRAIQVIDKINHFLVQKVNEKGSMEEVLSMMHSIVRSAESLNYTENKKTNEKVISKMTF